MTRRWSWLLVLVVGTAACAGVLGLRKRTRGPFEHRAHVLEGIPCVRCHAGVSESGEDGPVHLPVSASCVDNCHPKPHDRAPCLTCHTTEMAALGVIQARKHLRFQHRLHYTKLAGNCSRCHLGVAVEGARLRPTMASCLGCHAHRDQFDLRDCDGCHVDLPEELTRPESHLVHDGDFLREHGVRAAGSVDLCMSCHRERFCASCHGASAPTLPSRQYFDRPGAAGMHRAGFRARHGEEAHAQPGLCVTCHAEETCRSCHRDRGVAGTADLSGTNPHPAGWVGLSSNDHGPAARRDPVACASCHGGAGEALCVSCHAVGGVGGNPHPPGWSSTKSVGEVPCRACHRRLP